MEESKEKKPNYKIWHFGKDRWHRVTDERFYAENDDVAYKHLVEFENKTPVGDGKKFYYSSIHYIRCIHSSCNPVLLQMFYKSIQSAQGTRYNFLPQAG